MDELVSVIVAVYNVERYLDKCIDSIVNQTYPNLEIILINDGSTDKSKKICEKYAKRDDRITLINQENSGVSNVRNKGLDIAKGRYISFVDGDDFIELNMIEVMIYNIKQSKVKISICGYCIFDNNYKKIKQSDTSNEFKVLDSDAILKNIFTNNKINGFLWNKLFEKTVLDDIKLPEDMDICEDLYTVCNILKDNIKCCYTSQPLYNYRENPSSATKSIEKLFNNSGKLKYVDAFEKISELFYEKTWLLDLIRTKTIKTVLETYKLILKNRYKNDTVNKYIISELYKERKFYLSNKNVNMKYKIAFILFSIKLKLENIK